MLFFIIRRKKSVVEEVSSCINSLRRCRAWLLASKRAMRRDIAGLILLAGLPPTTVSDTYLSAAISELVKVRKKLCKVCKRDDIPQGLRDMLSEVVDLIPDSRSVFKSLSIDEIHEIVKECINRLLSIQSELMLYYPRE